MSSNLCARRLGRGGGGRTFGAFGGARFGRRSGADSGSSERDGQNESEERDNGRNAGGGVVPDGQTEQHDEDIESQRDPTCGSAKTAVGNFKTLPTDAG